MAGSAKNQYLAAICVNIFTFCYGTIIGWPSSALRTLQSENSPLKSGPITAEEASWIGAIMCIGGLLGNITAGWVSTKIGLKRTLLMASLPLISSFLMIPYAKKALHLCASRFMGGFFGSSAFALIPLYITEIAEDRVRGSLGSLVVIFCNIGILVSFILGSFFTYNVVAYLLAALPAIFLCSFVFLPETPSQLLKLGKEGDAFKALRFFRCDNGTKPSDKLLKEFGSLKSSVVLATEKDGKNESDSISFSDFTSTPGRKAMTIGIFLMFLNQSCGIFAMLNYTASIFEQAGSSLSPEMSAIIVALIQILGSYAATLFVERAGRKMLYLISSIGAGLGVSVLGIYIFLSSSGYDCSDFQWVPIGSFSLTIFFAQLAVLSLPFLVIAELLPPKIRSMGSNICVALLWIFSFSVLKGLPFLVEMFQLHGALLLFGGSCFVGALYILVFLPETKGRSIDEIMALLK